MSEPVTYPGGTQWAIKHNNMRRPVYEPIEAYPAVTEYEAKRKFARAMGLAQQTWPDNPDKWPQLVSAHITWQVVE
jgi:hypothetical protein